MREIKFRAWINALNCWADEIIISQVGDVWGYIAIKNDNKYFNAELEQFTGLRDKNGKEIYEGDICRIVRYNGELQTTGDIFFDKGAFRITNGYAVADTDSLGRFKADIVEIIGNIHENQELLK